MVVQASTPSGASTPKLLGHFQLQHPQLPSLPSSILLLSTAQNFKETHTESAMASTSGNAGRLDEAKELSKQDPSKAESVYSEVLAKGPGSSEASQRDYETALVGLGELYRDAKKPQELSELLETSRSTFSSFAKAKTSKLGTFYTTA